MFREILELLNRDNLQVQALSHCHEMLDLSEKMVAKAVHSLRGKGESPDLDVYQSDRILNSFERNVRRKVVTHLSLGNRADISSGLVLVSIVIDLERIGDYSKNIHDIATEHEGHLDAGELEPDVQKLEQASLDLFRGSAKAFKEGDLDFARRLMEQYKQDISAPYRSLESRLVSGQVTLGSEAAAVSLALYLRCLKRIGAHSRNLISSLVNPFDRIGYRE